MDRTIAIRDLALAREGQATLTSAYPELPLLVAQLRQRFAPEVFALLSAWHALEARERKAQCVLSEAPAWVDPPADTEPLYEGEDGA